MCDSIPIRVGSNLGDGIPQQSMIPSAWSTIAYKMPYLVKARSFLSLAAKMLVSLSKGTAWQVWQTRDGRKSASLMTSGPLHE